MNDGDFEILARVIRAEGGHGAIARRRDGEDLNKFQPQQGNAGLFSNHVVWSAETGQKAAEFLECETLRYPMCAALSPIGKANAGEETLETRAALWSNRHYRSISVDVRG